MESKCGSQMKTVSDLLISREVKFEKVLPDGYDSQTEIVAYHGSILISHPLKPALIYNPKTGELKEVQPDMLRDDGPCT